MIFYQDQIVFAMLHRRDGFGAIGRPRWSVAKLVQLRQDVTAIGGVILRHQAIRGLRPVAVNPLGETKSAVLVRSLAGFRATSSAPRHVRARSKTALNHKVELRLPGFGTPIFPTHHLDQSLADRQVEIRATILAGCGGVCLGERRRTGP